MKTKLITALRAAATAIESGTFAYDWTEPSRCNCGVLASAITGRSASELDTMIRGELPDELFPTWQNVIGFYCPVTGIPNNELFRQLFQCGLNQRDLINLEYLDDREVLTRMAAKRRKLFPRKIKYDYPEDVTDYMRA